MLMSEQLDSMGLTPHQKVTLRAALQAVESEREYTQRKWAGSTSEGKHSAFEWICYILDYAEEAFKYDVRHLDQDAKFFNLHTLRKIAHMALMGMMQNGALPREMEGPRAYGERAS